jgi:hypothetical protein
MVRVKNLSLRPAGKGHKKSSSAGGYKKPQSDAKKLVLESNEGRIRPLTLLTSH